MDTTADGAWINVVDLMPHIEGKTESELTAFLEGLRTGKSWEQSLERETR